MHSTTCCRRCDQYVHVIWYNGFIKRPKHSLDLDENDIFVFLVLANTPNHSFLFWRNEFHSSLLWDLVRCMISTYPTTSKYSFKKLKHKSITLRWKHTAPWPCPIMREYTCWMWLSMHSIVINVNTCQSCLFFMD